MIEEQIPGLPSYGYNDSLLSDFSFDQSNFVVKNIYPSLKEALTRYVRQHGTQHDFAAQVSIKQMDKYATFGLG